MSNSSTIFVADRQTIEQGLVVHSAYVVISIRDPGRRRAKVRRQAGLRDVLFLAFHDAEPSSAMALPRGIKLMSVKQAREIWQFIRRHEGIGSIVVQCEAGMSRSPAVAAAICQRLGGDASRFFLEHQPNGHVYGMLVDHAQTDQGRPRA